MVSDDHSLYNMTNERIKRGVYLVNTGMIDLLGAAGVGSSLIASLDDPKMLGIAAVNAVATFGFQYVQFKEELFDSSGPITFGDRYLDAHQAVYSTIDSFVRNATSCLVDKLK